MLTVGILFDTSFQGDIVSVPCRDVSQKFINRYIINHYCVVG